MTRSTYGSPIVWGRSLLRALACMAVVVPLVLAVDAKADPMQVPATLTDRRPVQVGMVEPGFPIDYLGVVWETSSVGPGSAVSGTQGEPHGAVRFRRHGSWGPWIPLIADPLQAPGQWGSSLVPGADADAFQVRGVPAGARYPRTVAINTTDGPVVTVGHRPSGAEAIDYCASRADWFADESLRFVDGEETWPPTFYPLQVVTVHHTATANNDPDPAATVRAIYVYHTVDRGWGDIAYHYLVDEQGMVYEGRFSGEESDSCDHFGFNDSGELVTGGHTYCFNGGNLGVALLGDFRRVEPTPEARDALEPALVEFLTRPDNDLNPLGFVGYLNPAPPGVCPDPPEVVSIEAISAHRDWPSPAGDTACPGDTFYRLLPDVRVNVAVLMGLELPTVSVGEVAYSSGGGRRGDKHLNVTISLDPPLTGAMVSVIIHGPSEVTQTALTDANGSMVVTIRSAAPGCYTTEVTAVDAPGWVWDGITPANSFGC